MTTHDEFREKEWGAADGRRIKIKDMDLGHLVNVINWVHDHPHYPNSIREGMVAEAEYRKLSLFAEGKAYPRKVDGKWTIYNPETKECAIVPPPADYIEAVKDNPVYQKMTKQAQKKRQLAKRKNG